MNNIRETTFEIAVLHGTPVIFSFEHILQSKVPSDLFRYDIRHADKNPSLPVQLEHSVSDQYYGTILSKDQIELEIDPKNLSMPAGKSISEQDFKIDDYASLKEMGIFPDEAKVTESKAIYSATKYQNEHRSDSVKKPVNKVPSR